MSKNQNSTPIVIHTRWQNHLMGFVLFVFVWLVYLSGPVTQVTDSRYTLLLSEQLIDSQTFRLTVHFQRPLDPQRYPSILPNGLPYQVEEVDDDVFLFFPFGSSVLSVPFMGIAKTFGGSCLDEEGQYSPGNEDRLHKILSGLLMAFSAWMIYHWTVRNFGLRRALALALIFAFSTSAWSLGSRALWSCSWGVTLLIAALYLSQHQQTNWKGVCINLLLATILAFAYFVRPTFTISILGITILMLFKDWKQGLVLMGGGVVWILAFALYSQHYFGSWLPNYFQASRLGGGSFWEAFFGNLISPSRGLFFYSPILMVPLIAMFFCGKKILTNPVSLTAIIVIILHLISVSTFWHWYGGHSYGPRFMFDVVPWLIPIMHIIFKTVDDQMMSPKVWKAMTVSALILFPVSAFQHGVAAYFDSTWRWNMKPRPIDEAKWRNWDWKQPQSLSWFLPASHPPEFPSYKIGEKIYPGESQTHPTMWTGWALWPEGSFRWNDGNEIELIFAINPDSPPTSFRFSCFPFLDDGNLTSQQIIIFANDQLIAKDSIENGGEYSYDLTSLNLSTEKLVVRIELPDATNPEYDPRTLGLGIQWYVLE